MQKITETDLVSRLSHGDVQAFKDIYDRYWSRVVAVCHRCIGIEETAAELAQDIFFSLWSRREQLPLDLPLSAYLHQAAKNQSFRYLRDKQRLERRQAGYHPVHQEDASFDIIQFKQLQHSYAQSMKAVGEPGRTIFHLSREKQLTHREIASQLNISVKTVEYHIGKTLQFLRRSLRDYLNS